MGAAGGAGRRTGLLCGTGVRVGLRARPRAACLGSTREALPRESTGSANVVLLLCAAVRGAAGHGAPRAATFGSRRVRASPRSGGERWLWGVGTSE